MQAPEEQFLVDRIFLHMPEGNIGKEGPSAGMAILTAFVTLFNHNFAPNANPKHNTNL